MINAEVFLVIFCSNPFLCLYFTAQWDYNQYVQVVGPLFLFISIMKYKLRLS